MTQRPASKTHCEFGLNISKFWTPRFPVWITHFGWTPCLKYALRQIFRLIEQLDIHVYVYKRQRTAQHDSPVPKSGKAIDSIFIDSTVSRHLMMRSCQSLDAGLFLS